MSIKHFGALLASCMLWSGPATILSNTLIAASAPTFDQYGGIEQLPSLNGPTGHWHLEQMNRHWTLIDPDGNAFFMLGVEEILADDYLNALNVSYRTTTVEKYGDNGAPNWGPAQVERLRSWSFNTVGSYSSIYVVPVHKENVWPGDHYNPQKMPFLYNLRPSYYGMLNSPRYISEPVKSFVYGINTEYDAEYIPPGGEADYYDPKLYSYLDALLQYDQQMTELNDPKNPYRQWLIGVAGDESDQTYSFSSGTDFVTLPAAGHSHAHGGYRVAICSPVQTANSKKYAIYSDTTVYIKQAWITYLESLSKYQTSGVADVRKLNAAWGSDYSTWNSSGRAETGVKIGTGTGSGTRFSGTLTPTAVSKYSLQVLVAGSNVGGDVGNGTIWGPFLSGTIDYESGAVSLTFESGHAPANGVSIAANYVANGWGVGTGLLDEDGRHTSWIGTDSTSLKGSNANFVADINGFLYQMAKYYFHTGKTHTLSHFNALLSGWNPLYLGPDVLFSWSTPPRAPVLQAAGEELDALVGGRDPLPQDRLDFVYQYAGDKPLLDFGASMANPDSAMWRYPNDSGSDGYSNQSDRAAAYRNGLLGTGNPPGLISAAYTVTKTNPYIGILWWKYIDTPGEHSNWGLVTPSDNAYDGHEAVYTNSNYTRTVACSPPLSSYKCGGEEHTYGNFNGRVGYANQTAEQSFCQSLGGCK